MEFHEAANIFPLDDEHLDALADDIEEHGLQIPIEICGGQILDGRRRYQACRMRGIEPDMVEVDPDDPVAYVLSLNLHRRHLSISQLAMVADKARDLYDERAKERKTNGAVKGGKASGASRRGESKLEEISPQASREPQSRDAAGAAVGISGWTADRARKVRRDGIPELVKAVEEDKLSVNRAAEIAALPKDQQADAMARPKRPKPAQSKEEPPEDETNRESRGVGVRRGNEAIDCLKRIPKNDALRKRGFQIVTDWIRRYK